MNLAMNPVIVRVTQLPNGVLYPDINGEGQATVTFNRDDANTLTANISFGGATQASVIYDQGGNVVVGYHVTDPMASLATLQSIENIIYQLNPVMGKVL